MYERAPRSEDIEEVPFNPRHASGFGWRSLEINGEEVYIHHTNNLSELIWAYIITAERRPPRSLSEQAYSQAVQEDGVFSDAIQRFSSNYPNLFQSVYDLLHQHRLMDAWQPDVILHSAQLTQEVTPSHRELMDFHLSMAFDALADEVLQIHPDYDVENLCR